jgi:hypothetical protein
MILKEGNTFKTNDMKNRPYIGILQTDLTLPQFSEIRKLGSQ